MTRTRTIALASVLLLALVACGDDKAASPDRGSADRTVEVDMVDIASEPEVIDVAAGETVRFVFRRVEARHPLRTRAPANSIHQRPG